MPAKTRKRNINEVSNQEVEVSDVDLDLNKMDINKMDLTESESEGQESMAQLAKDIKKRKDRDHDQSLSAI